MTARRRARAAVIGLALAAAACTSVDAAIDKHGKKVGAKLDRVEEVRDLVGKRPLLATDALDEKGLVLNLFAGPGRRTNAALVYLEDLATLEELGNVYGRIPATDGVAECASFLRHKTLPWNPRSTTHWLGPILGSEVTARFEDCERLQWLLVVRTVELALPSAGEVTTASSATPSAAPAPSGSVAPTALPLASAASSAVAGDAAPASGTRPSREEADATSCARPGATCYFGGGYAKYEVHVFSLDPVASVGGFVFEAESSDRVNASSGSIEADFSAAAKNALVAALKKQGASVELVQ